MSQVRIGPTIELTYMSPNEMVDDMQGALGEDGLFMATDAEIPAGEQRPVRIKVPWLGRHIQLRGEVLRPASGGGARGLRLRLLDGPHDTLEKLEEIIGRIKSGAFLDESSEDGVPPERRIRALSPTLRSMLAVKANAEERAILSRDPDPRVIEHLLKNPSLRLEEVRRIASRLSLHQGHFSIIMRNNAWMGDEPLRDILARNPRLPEFMAGRVLQTLPSKTLNEFVKSMNITAATKRAAQKILRGRGAEMGQQRRRF